MGFYRLPLYFADNKFYYSPPGELKWCTKDDDGIIWCDGVQISISTDQRPFDGKLYRAHAIRYINVDLYVVGGSPTLKVQNQNPNGRILY
jgi:hypothetical protein